jgi:fused signal recognition particle receptor
MLTLLPTLLATLLEAVDTTGGGLDGTTIGVIVAVVVAVLAGGGFVVTRGGGTDTLERPPADAAPVDSDAAVAADDDLAAVVEPDSEPSPEPQELSLADRFRTRLSRTANAFGTTVAELFGGGVTDEVWDGLEEALITADVGVMATTEIVEELRRTARDEGITDGGELLALLKRELRAAIGDADRSLNRATDQGPTVWLVTGVNGAGKTTTIGKLAAVERRAGTDVVLAAADTFRAAAAEQLMLWGERTDQHVVRGLEGSDPASVAFEGYKAAVERGASLCIIDTAGRLHNKTELMDELGKVKRVVEKQSGPIEEILLVLDGTTGQNGIAQARAFTDAVAVTGIALTKLDGSSRGGIVVAVQRELGIPVKLVGLGEDIDDLAPFDPELFVDGLFAEVGL